MAVSAIVLTTIKLAALQQEITVKQLAAGSFQNVCFFRFGFTYVLHVALG